MKPSCFHWAVLLCLVPVAAAHAQQIGFAAFAVPDENDYNPASVGIDGITTGPDGAVWFTELRTSQIGRITTAGATTQYAVPSAGKDTGPLGITVGPDGALWFTERDTIGRITTAGAVTTFPAAAPNGGPSQIITGPDGALWFTETYDNQIGRMTTTGALTVYPLAEPNSYPTGITVGSDGAIWFAETTALGRITTDGALSEFPIPVNQSALQITSGPDGALWFTGTSETGGTIGRMTTEGAFTAYPLGTYAGTFAIITGPDGALWFTAYFSEELPELGRITTTGAVSFYHMPFRIPSPLGDGMTVGPDGEFWFTLWENNVIGEALFETAALTVSPTEAYYDSTVSFSGSGFTPGEKVVVYKDGVGSEWLGSASANTSGAFAFSVGAPRSPYLFGPRIFIAVGQSSGLVGTASFTLKPRLSGARPDPAPPGSTVTIEGFGFGSKEVVGIIWDNPKTFLGRVGTDINGSFSGDHAFTFTIPAGAPAGKNGIYGHGHHTGEIGSGSITVE